MAWIHAFANNAPVSYPQDHPEDALSSAGHGNVSVSRTAGQARKIRSGIPNLDGVNF
jgi:hypothetical protein